MMGDTATTLRKCDIILRVRLRAGRELWSAKPSSFSSRRICYKRNSIARRRIWELWKWTGAIRYERFFKSTTENARSNGTIVRPPPLPPIEAEGVIGIDFGDQPDVSLGKQARDSFREEAPQRRPGCIALHVIDQNPQDARSPRRAARTCGSQFSAPENSW